MYFGERTRDGQIYLTGYLDVGAGKHLHYMLSESENKPSDDPVVFWFNGGPGCSSLDGFFYEHGVRIVPCVFVSHYVTSRSVDVCMLYNAIAGPCADTALCTSSS
jgi:hypothetical protein